MRLSSSKPKFSLPQLEAELRKLKQDPTKETTEEYAKRYSELMARIQTEKQQIALSESLEQFRAARVKREQNFKILLFLLCVSLVSFLILYIGTR